MFLTILLHYQFEHFLRNVWIYFNTYSTVKYQPHLNQRSLTVVNILGSQKCALSLAVPQTLFNNWPEDDSLSRNMSPL
jgi:hypothetical protein